MNALTNQMNGILVNVNKNIAEKDQKEIEQAQSILPALIGFTVTLR
jgi:hypothetical protein